MTGAPCSNPAVELDSALGGDLDATSLSASDIDSTGPDIPHILLEADAFITKYELFEMRDTIRKGILLFYRPYGIAGIEEDEYLGNEGNQGDIKGKPPGSAVSTSICFAAGFLHAFLESSYNPTIFYPHPDGNWSYWESEGLWFWEYPKGFWEAVLLSSIVHLISAILSFWLSLILNRHWGRLRAFRVAAVIALVAFLGKFICPGTIVAFVADIFCVVSMVILTSTVLLYISETSEASKRSHAMKIWYFGCMPLRGIARVIIATELGPLSLLFSVLAGCLTLGLSTQSLESPYWLALNGPIPAAFDSLRGFRDTEIIAARDLYNIYVTEDPNDSKNGSFTWPKSSSRPIRVVISIISASCFVSLHVAAELIFTVYISEVFPLYYREMGVAFIICFFNACTAILSLIAGFEKGLNIPHSQLHIL
ncbi:Major facilitator superfamily domain general substrate transporter [Penicillium canescens]|uniref:Major facilitator superfamily domain general substrate transporter n=1 Tax=Penicillium canescens TaxID=5083 RepID=A0AAD6ICT5_PENCN|nr:Major facilitator superfamily domain general substrate transporter [Penicillium canescens]